MKKYQLTEEQIKELIVKATGEAEDKGITIEVAADRMFRDFLVEYTQNVGTEKATKLGERYGTVTNSVIQAQQVKKCLKVAVICNSFEEFKEYMKETAKIIGLDYAQISKPTDSIMVCEVDALIYTFCKVSNVENARSNIWNSYERIKNGYRNLHLIEQEVKLHLKSNTFLK